MCLVCLVGLAVVRGCDWPVCLCCHATNTRSNPHTPRLHAAHPPHRCATQCPRAHTSASTTRLATFSSQRIRWGAMARVRAGVLCVVCRVSCVVCRVSCVCVTWLSPVGEEARAAHTRAWRSARSVTCRATHHTHHTGQARAAVRHAPQLGAAQGRDNAHDALDHHRCEILGGGSCARVFV
jgi:hypothetical protein